MLLAIQNDGAEIRETNYWDSDRAQRGLFYLSGNAGVWRLLVPPGSEGQYLPEIRTGKRVVIEPSLQMTGCVDLVFEDGSDAPFFLTLDRKHSIDRSLSPAGACRLSVWTRAGKQFELPCQVSERA